MVIDDDIRNSFIIENPANCTNNSCDAIICTKVCYLYDVISSLSSVRCDKMNLSVIAAYQNALQQDMDRFLSPTGE